MGKDPKYKGESPSEKPLTKKVKLYLGFDINPEYNKKYEKIVNDAINDLKYYIENSFVFKDYGTDPEHITLQFKFTIENIDEY